MTERDQKRPQTEDHSMTTKTITIAEGTPREGSMTGSCNRAHNETFRRNKKKNKYKETKPRLLRSFYGARDKHKDSGLEKERQRDTPRRAGTKVPLFLGFTQPPILRRDRLHHAERKVNPQEDREKNNRICKKGQGKRSKGMPRPRNRTASSIVRDKL